MLDGLDILDLINKKKGRPQNPAYTCALKSCHTCLEVKSVSLFAKTKNDTRNICKKCHAKQARELALKNIEGHNQKKRNWYHKNKKDILAKTAVDYRKRPEYYKNKDYKAKYGISLEAVQSMIEGQNGRCRICNNLFTDTKSTHVDHCHTTGAVRGILCQRCNVQLGWFEKNRESVLKYLGVD